jgi:hypothetical protein
VRPFISQGKVRFENKRQKYKKVKLGRTVVERSPNVVNIRRLGIEFLSHIFACELLKRSIFDAQVIEDMI